MVSYARMYDDPMPATYFCEVKASNTAAGVSAISEVEFINYAGFVSNATDATETSTGDRSASSGGTTAAVVIVILLLLAAGYAGYDKKDQIASYFEGSGKLTGIVQALSEPSDMIGRFWVASNHPFIIEPGHTPP